MAEVKKRGRPVNPDKPVKEKKVKEPKADKEKTSGLPTTGSILNPALFAALQKITRTRDLNWLMDKFEAMHHSEQLEKVWSEPVVRNLLNTGYCTDPKLWNAVVKLYAAREQEEKNAGKILLAERIENMQAFLELEKKYNELKPAFANLN